MSWRDTPCKLWTGATVEGYGIKKVPHERKNQLVHRAVWVTNHGEIPEGHRLRHLCGIRRCYELEHLQVATVAEIGRLSWRQRRESVA